MDSKQLHDELEAILFAYSHKMQIASTLQRERSTTNWAVNKLVQLINKLLKEVAK